MTATLLAPVELRATHLDVVLDIPNDILRLGLEAALRDLAVVGSVRRANPAAPVGRDEILVVAAGTGWRSEPHPDVKVLLILADPRGADLVSAGGLRADGFVLQQDLSGRALDAALRAMAAGDMPMPARMAQQLLADAGVRRTTHTALPMALTPREKETLALLTEGLSNKQIARRLKISDHGAKRLVAGVLLKLGSSNRTEAVVTAIRAGLINCA